MNSPLDPSSDARAPRALLTGLVPVFFLGSGLASLPAAPARGASVAAAGTDAAADATPPPSPAFHLARAFTFHHGDVLGTSLDLTVIAPSADDADAAEKAVLDEVERLRRILSSYDPAAELARVNAAAGTDAPVKVSPDLLDVLHQYDAWRRRTGGAYDGRLGELIALWQRAERTDQLPTDADLADAARRLARPAWRIDDARGTVQRLTPQPINVDSLGKGYILGKAVEAVRRQVPGVCGVLLNIGGDLRAWGSPTADPAAAWPVGVQDPAHAELNAPTVTTLLVRDRAVATSGAYERFYTIQDRRYSHILDPRTGRPAPPTAATVVAADNATANALATTLCVLSPAEGLALVGSVPGAECLIVTPDGKQVRSAGFRFLEAAPAEAKAPPAASAPAAQWPAGYRVAVNLETTKTGRHKPYVFVWVTDAAGKHVKTLGAWGNEDKWLREIRGWWKFAQNDKSLRSVTHATQQPGKYPVAWDGTDQQGNPVPTGAYTVWVQVASEHGPNVSKSVKIDCGAAPASAKIPASAAFLEIPVEYGPAPAAKEK